MKKLFTTVILAVCAAVLCFSLAACNANTEPTEPSEPTGDVYYTVTFDSMGGSEVESQRILSGNRATLPETPEREGYFLLGWYDAAEDGEIWTFDTDRVTGNITLYAYWEALPEEDEPLPATESLTYERYESGYAVTGVGDETVVVIPSEYDGLPVIAIRGQYGTGAFARSAMTSVVIPDSIIEIGNNSFYNCTQLTFVQFGSDSALASIGRNAFSGCHSLAEIYIPASVTSIGDSAFNNCGAVNFTVADGNAAYRSENGHLIERTTNTLLRAGQDGTIPDGIQIIADFAFSRSVSVTELYIPSSVTEIGNYIAANATLSSIHYAGTEEAWNAVQKGSLWDLDNENVQMIFEGE